MAMAQILSLLPRMDCRTCPARHEGLCQPMRSEEELADLARIRLGVRIAPPRCVIRSQGDEPGLALVVLSGWAAAFHTLPDGRRHITRFLTVGSLIDAEPNGLVHTIESVEAVTETAVCVQSEEALNALRAKYPLLEARFVWLLERQLVRDIERATALAQLSAKERLANLLLHLAVRAARRYPPREGEHIPLPLTQALLGEATGLTAVHVNRMLRQLTIEGVLTFQSGRLCILNLRRLEAMAASDPGVLALFAGEHPEPTALRTLPN